MGATTQFLSYDTKGSLVQDKIKTGPKSLRSSLLSAYYRKATKRIKPPSWKLGVHD